MNGIEMPKYKCHKEVWALKIADIQPTRDENQIVSGAFIFPAEEGYAQFHVTREYVAKHNPQVGGYYVVYADGYASFSPAQAFEEGYTKL